MLLTRFWILFLGVAAAAAIAAAMLGQSVINARSDSNVAQALKRDREVVNALLKLEARERLDRIAFITIDTTVGNILRQARGLTDAKKLAELNGTLKEALRGHVTSIVEAARSEGKSAEEAKSLEPDIVFALDADGRIIAQLGPLEANPPGSGLGTYPLVRRALQGYLRDDVWVYDRRVYRMAARPVVSGSDYAGAIVHGYRLNDAFAQKLGQALAGATVAFFYGDSLLGSYAPADTPGAPQGADLAGSLAALAKDADFQAGKRTDAKELQKNAYAVFTPVVGAAATAGVGYAIARPRVRIANPSQMFEEATEDEVKALPWPLIAGAALVLAALGLLFIYVERDRHLKSLMRKTTEIGKGERDRLIITEWRGAYRRLADSVNQAIDYMTDKAAQVAPSRKKANLDEILGPTPEASSTPFFGFAADEPGTGEQAVATPAGLPAKPKPVPPAVAAAPAPAAPPAITPPSATRARTPSPIPPPPKPAAAPAPKSSNGAHSEEDVHWREVYNEYVATRKQCGESIDNLTFEKFGVTLKKTRDQIIEKHGAKAVRFSVQVKQGKAALKAQPVK